MSNNKLSNQGDYEVVLSRAGGRGRPRKDEIRGSYSIKLVKQPNIYSAEQVLRYLAEPGNINWVKADHLLDTLNDACVDGRETERVIASPGGDIAILTEAIISIGKLVHRHLDPVEIRKVFKWRVQKMGSFYFHTDTHALHNLKKSLNGEPMLGRRFKSVDEVLKFLKRPPARLQTMLMSHLFKIENVGCGHLKLMLLNPKAYGMSRKVIQGIMRAFFNVMWNGTIKEKSLINFQVLEGGHHEGAVVTVLVKGKLRRESLVPAVRPSNKGMSMFVFHPQVTEFMHQTLAVELARSSLFPEISKSQVRDFKRTMGEVLQEGLRETVSRLAFGLPMYTFEFKLL